MRIARVAWTNYRRIPDADILVGTHLVLVGPNDSGKSSVLRALDMCLGMNRAQLANAVTARDFTDLTQPLRVEVTLRELTELERAAFPDEVDTSGAEDEIIVVLEASAATDLLDEVVSDSAVGEVIDIQRYFRNSGHSRGPSRLQLDSIAWTFLPAARSLSRELDGTGGMVRGLLNGLDLGDDAAAVEEALVTLTSSIQGASAVQSLTTNLAGALSRALPREVEAGDVQVSSSSDLGKSALSNMTVTIQDGGSPTSLAEQSDGIRALSLLAVMAVSRESARILAVDEPENHLHATAQRSVARSLQTSERQTVLATHAPAIVRLVHPGHVVAFGPDRTARQLASGSPFLSATTAAKYWTPPLVEALTARQVLFVEGQSDQILCEAVAESLDLRFNERGVTVIELGGGDSFPLAHALIGPTGFGVTCTGMLDEDKRVKWAEALGVAPADLESRGFMVCDPDLEAMYIDALGVERVLELLMALPDLSRRGLLDVSGAADVSDVDSVGLWKYCHKYKVTAAVAIAEGLTIDDVAKLAFLGTHLRSLS